MSSDIYSSTLSQLASSGNLRAVPGADTPAGLVDLSSNDYLGLASRPELQAEFMEQAANRAIPLSSSAARLLSGRQSEYASLESLLSELYGCETLLFNSGYHANAGLVSALASPAGTFIAADRLVHASIIDGITLSRAPFGRFRHNDMEHLERMVTAKEKEYERVLVVVESVYSMDGDSAPIAELIALRRRHPSVMLYVDEAHAFGVLGPQGLGLCMATADSSEIDVIVGTFGKACCSMGAFAALSPTLREYAVNRSRSFIFSTALPPLQVAWTEFVIRKFLDMDAERSHLARLGSQLAGAIGASVGSHILPYMTGDPAEAVRLSRALLDDGFKVLPIRTPTVPPGTDRLRISLSAALSMQDIEGFARALKNKTARCSSN